MLEQTAFLVSGANVAQEQKPTGNTEIGEVCIPNISAEERRKRLRMGVTMFVLSLAVLGVLLATGASRWWRMPLFFLFAAAATGFFQWRDKTCIKYAARDSRKLGDAEEKIVDRAELAQVRRQARRVLIQSIAAAVVLTCIALVLPSLM
jgi:hypothetical protein